HGGGQVATNREWCLWRHPGQRFELKQRDGNATREHLSHGIEPIHLDQHQVLFDSRRRALTGTILYESERVTVHAEQIIRDREAALRREELADLHADVADHASLPRTALPLV